MVAIIASQDNSTFMKRYISSIIICLLAITFVNAQDYKVVFDMTSKDSVNQQALIRQLDYIKETNASSKLEVVIYGEGLGLILKDRSPLQSSITKLINSDHVSFKVCGATMKRNNIDKSQLIPGVEVVPDGIYEIITRQKEGWGYIKVAH
jgi:intracellular sulfur oxidation DsrE/DsrF family protein